MEAKRARKGRAAAWSGLALAVLVAGLAASWLLGNLLTRPSPSFVAAARPPAVDFRIRTADGLAVAGTYWAGRRPDSPGMLLLHGNGASRAAMADNGAWLAGQGYAVLTIDFRGHGQSPAVPHSFGLYESRDAEAAFGWLKKRQHGAPVAVLGVSLGGAAALLGARGPLPAEAMILQAVYPDIRHAIGNRIASFTTTAPAFLLEPLLSYQSLPRLGVLPDRLAPLRALRTYRGPVLVIGGTADLYTPPIETKAMFDAARGEKAIWLAPGTDHAQTSDLRTAAYRRRVLGFLRSEIGEPSPQPRAGSSSAAGCGCRISRSPR